MLPLSPLRRFVIVALLGLLGMSLGATEATAQVSGADPDGREAAEQLQEAILAYQRGDLGAADDGFDAVLDFPVQIRDREELHEGFLHWAYTLFLQNSVNQASEKLSIALRLQPEHQPSPVVLRPDLYAFYQEARAAFLTERAAQPAGERLEPLTTIFPELQVKAGAMGPGGFILPVLGVGLERLGHRAEGRILGVVEGAALAVNGTAFFMRLAAFNELTPAGDLVHDLSVGMNVVSFFVFWPVVIADIVATLSLQKRYTDRPELRPRLSGATGRKRAPPPILRVQAGGLTLAFW